MTAIAARSRRSRTVRGRGVPSGCLSSSDARSFLASSRSSTGVLPSATTSRGVRTESAGFECDAAALGQKVEPVAERRSGELDARGLERRLQFLQVRGHGRRRERTQRHALALTPRAEAPDGAPVGFARIGIRHSGGEELEREAGHEVAGVRRSSAAAPSRRRPGRGRPPPATWRGASATRAVESGSGRGMVFPLDNVFYPLQT